LWIYSASTTFHLFPSKNLILNLGVQVLRNQRGQLYPADSISELAVIRHILDTRAVLATNITIQVHHGPYMSILDQIGALYPYMRRHPTLPACYIPPWHTWPEWEVKELYLKHTSPAELWKLEDDAYMTELETIKDTLLERHAKTDVEKADFERIKFSYMRMESGDSYILSGYYGPMAMAGQ
jgi:hypothetical protein